MKELTKKEKREQRANSVLDQLTMYRDNLTVFIGMKAPVDGSPESLKMLGLRLELESVEQAVNTLKFIEQID